MYGDESMRNAGSGYQRSRRTLYGRIDERLSSFLESILGSPHYLRWASTLQPDVTADPLWRVSAYRLSSYLGDMAWDDARVLWGNGVTRPVASQLYRAVWSVSANMAEGYSRASGRDRARMFEYALGSAREAAVWYHAGRHVRSDEILSVRRATLAEIRRLLLVMVPVERKK
jgi:four helix bundle protein